MKRLMKNSVEKKKLEKKKRGGRKSYAPLLDLLPPPPPLSAPAATSAAISRKAFSTSPQSLTTSTFGCSPTAGGCFAHGYPPCQSYNNTFMPASAHSAA